jgi:hypothetical protein
VGLPPRKISSFLRSVKDDFGLKKPGTYSIPCECGQAYIGQTDRSTDNRMMEPQRHIRLEYPDKSAVAGHSSNLGHRTQLHHTILFIKPRYMDRIMREAAELHPNNMNMEDGFCLSKSRKPLICSLKGRRKPPPHDSRSGFSAGPRRSVHTALIGAQNIPLRALTASTLMSPLPSATSAPSAPIACLRLTHLASTPYTSVPCPTHPYAFPVFFLDQQNHPSSGRSKALFFPSTGSLGGRVRVPRFHSLTR